MRVGWCRRRVPVVDFTESQPNAMILTYGTFTAALTIGPQFDTQGVDGLLAPRFFGFGAQPVLVTDVDGELPARGRLYFGGNADLYVLVDPCNENEIEFVSVGAHRLVVADEVTCAAPGGN